MNEYDLASFRRSHPAISRSHRRFLADLFALWDVVLEELLRTVKLIARRPEAERGEGTFLFAYQLLASKVISHAESIAALVRLARYGDACMLMRGLMGDTIMIQYLAAYPQDVAEWFEMAEIREPKRTKGSRFAKLADKFSEHRLRSEIGKAGDRAISSETYGIYSEPAHPSLWGMKFYAVQESGQQASFTFTYKPVFQAIASFRCVVNAAGMTLDATHCFFVWMQRQSVTWGKEDLSRWVSVCDPLLAQLKDAFDWLERNHVKLYGDPTAPDSPPPCL